jgi:hypothetical protein
MDNSRDELKNGAVIPGQFVRLTGDMARIDHPGKSVSLEPRVELIRQGDEIQAIEVTCSCGQRIRLLCVYQ